MEHQPKRTALSKCPSCKSNQFESYLKTKDYFLSQEDFNLDKCRNCGLVFTNPIPRLDQLSRYYDSPDYLSHTANSKTPKAILYNRLRDLNLTNKYKMISGFVSEGKALDIGQGTGEFLNFLKRKGWQVTGVEPNESAREFAKKNYQIDVFEEDSLKNLDKNSFDLITMWHVLEHVPDLHERLNEIKLLIKKEGFLVIAVPNLNAPDAVKYKDKWAALDVPRHLYHFTADSMERLLQQYDFKIEATFPLKMDAYYVSMLSEKYLGKSVAPLRAFFAGYQSNRMARKNNNYSSMVFVARQK